jgi:nucleoid-associated protein YgaU
MNRQVGPSIVCSVLIVCFFAVALFPHSRPASSKNPPRANVHAERLVSRVSAPAARSQPAGSEIEPDTPIASAELRPRSPAASAATAGGHPTRIAGATLSSENHAVADAAASGRDDENHSATRGPMSTSSVTVVQQNETMLDVARRVYGSGDQVETLWRANRDALASVDAPLSSGMVLRTPRIR